MKSKLAKRSFLLAFVFAACAHQAERVSVATREPANEACQGSLTRFLSFEGTFKDRDLFDFRDYVLSWQGKEGIKRHNDHFLRVLATARPSPKVNGRWQGALTREKAMGLYRWLDNNPHASLRNLRNYDPELRIGFCFGRAAAVHLEALRGTFKLHPTSIRKIWVVGPMKGGWGHHVATMVLSQSKPNSYQYLVVDPETGLLTAEEWMKKLVRDYEQKDHPLMFFSTDANRFGPAPGKYTSTELFSADRGNAASDGYKNYFHDLMVKFRVDRIASTGGVDLTKQFQAELDRAAQMAAEMGPREGILDDLAVDGNP